jgi:bifunctional DNA-binding transcriptional regulator/antitoxin component of YhaV-PrlF toxin-antitoxin module
MNRPVDSSSYEVITQVDPKTGDTIIPIPTELLQRMEWQEGDILNIMRANDGRIFLTKAKK